MAVAYETVNIAAVEEEFGCEQVITVPKIVLEQPAIFREWLCEPDTVPDAVRRGAAEKGAEFYFNVHPEVLRALVRFLEDPKRGAAAVYFEAPPEQIPFLLVKLYKLALTLAYVF